LKIREEGSALFSYSSYYFLQYRKTCIIDGKEVLGLFQRKFNLELPPDFKKLKREEQTDRIFPHIIPIDSLIHFYTICPQHLRKKVLDRRNYIFKETKKLKLTLEGIPQKELNKVYSYYSRICRSSMLLKGLSDKGGDFDLKPLEERELIKVSFYKK
jgi:hypothetical protein